jgi:SAM-dependent methyltransferase
VDFEGNVDFLDRSLKRPQPLPLVHEKKIVEQFTAQVERFVASPHVNQPEPVARFVAAVAPHPDERALDVACGPGLLARAFAPRVREFVGVDLTPAMVEKASAIAREAGLANARFEVGDALRLPFEKDSFDLVLTRLALHHMPDAGAAVAEMARVLRADGAARLGVFDMTTSELAPEADYHNLVERLRDPSHARALPISELARMAGLAGLQVDDVETIDYELEVEDWIARADQSAEGATRARELIASAIGSHRFGGKRVRRDAASGRLFFTVRWAIVVATKPSK